MSCITVRCYSCSNVLADKYEYYVQEVRQRKMERTDELKQKSKQYRFDNVVYLTNEVSDIETPEKMVLDELGLTRICCRRHMLSHV
jgi:DNA-directed RNA polymerase subunit N (RpoN/RPB10)